MTGNGAERRKSPRLRVELHVEFRHLGRPNETYADICRNLSTGGVFLDTTVGLELGTEVDLEIAPGPGVRPIKMRAEVVRVEEEPVSTGSKVTTRTRGMALRFVDAESNEITRLLTLATQMQAANESGNDVRNRRS
ncbi:PilZ domain-containing protein [Myxococcota bacterium]|nr:PilZ domain-containing protein [Myxococcota bacterium]